MKLLQFLYLNFLCCFLKINICKLNNNAFHKSLLPSILLPPPSHPGSLFELRDVSVFPNTESPRSGHTELGALRGSASCGGSGLSKASCS